MKVSIVRGGGLGGFSTRTELDAAALPGDAARTLDEKARAAAAAPSAPAPAAHPEDQLYEITIEGGAAPKVLHFRESALPEPVQGLVDWLDARPERTTSVER